MKTFNALLHRVTVVILFVCLFMLRAHAVTVTSTATGGAWSNPSTWVGNALPGKANDVMIVGNVAINSGDNFGVGNLTIDQNATLTLKAGGFLKVNGKLFLGSTATSLGFLIMISDRNNPSGLIATLGVLPRFTSTVTIKQTLSPTSGTRKFHVMGVPFSSATAPVTVANFLNDNGSKLEKNNTNTLYALARYEESINGWIYLENGASAWTTPTAQSNLDPSYGYAMALKSGAGNDTLILSGKPINGSPVVVPLIKSTSGTPPKGGFGWNAVANPYLTNLNVNTLLSRNIDVLDSNFGGIYLWDPDSQSYTVYTLASSARDIPVCQGFLVRATTNKISFIFEYNQLENNSGASFKSAQLSRNPEITLKANTNSLQRMTSFSFADQMTTGLDPFYDAGYLASGNGMELYSKMINGSPENFAVQALPTSGFDELIIPIQLDLNKGAEVAFSAEIDGFPSGSKVVLEDRSNGILTDLKQEPSYKVDLAGNLTALQRFYLHISLNGETFSLANTAQEEPQITSIGTDICVSGTFLPQSKAMVFDLTGVKLGSYDLNQMGTTHINTNLKTGVYLVKIAQPNLKTITEKVYLRN
ncbi:MAG: hypothetical protein LWW85_10135 [Marinilabiliales bacterium]|nr:hypothetical protein [Marinilabiliales bacterium]